MTREEYMTAAGVYFERLLMPLKDIPSDRFELTLSDGSETVNELFNELGRHAERMVRALELLYQGVEPDHTKLLSTTARTDSKRALTTFRISHSTVMAALERVPYTRFADSGELPEWIVENYLVHLESAAPRIETWSIALRKRGLGGPQGLPVIQ